MSARTVIDGLEFVRSGREQQGTVAVESLTRLADLLQDSGGSIAYKLWGEHDARGRPQLKLQVNGTLNLQCQRCLGGMEMPVDLESTLLLQRTGEEADEDADDPDAPDAIEAGTEIDVAELVEDEILLGLPFAPRHPEGVCRTVRAGETQPKAANASAFAAKLAAWKKLDR